MLVTVVGVPVVCPSSVPVLSHVYTVLTAGPLHRTQHCSQRRAVLADVRGALYLTNRGVKVKVERGSLHLNGQGLPS